VTLRLLDALAELEADEARDRDRAARRLARRLAKLVDRLAGDDARLLLEERDLGVPLVELALDDLRPRRFGLRLRILAELALVDLLLLFDELAVDLIALHDERVHRGDLERRLLDELRDLGVLRGGRRVRRDREEDADLSAEVHVTVHDAVLARGNLEALP